jgi:hypothetical protein
LLLTILPADGRFVKTSRGMFLRGEDPHVFSRVLITCNNFHLVGGKVVQTVSFIFELIIAVFLDRRANRWQHVAKPFFDDGYLLQARCV